MTTETKLKTMAIQPTRRLDAIVSRLEDLELNLPPGKIRDYVAESKAALKGG